MESEKIYVLFGGRVAEARTRADMTQQQLAKKVGLSRASIANIEAGRQRIVLHQAIEISEALDLSSVTELLPADLLRPATRFKTNLKLNLTGSQLSKQEEASIRSIVASS